MREGSEASRQDDAALRIATAAFSSGRPAALQSLVELGASDAASLGVASELPIAPVGALAAGDVDGDGVHDLVLGAGSLTLLLKGEPVNR